MSSLAILILAFYFDLATVVKTDKLLAGFNTVPLLTSLATTVLFVNNEPWSDGKIATKRPLITDLFTYCSLLDNSAVDPFRPLMFQRCMLTDMTWVLACFLLVLWLVLLIMASTLPRSLTTTAEPGAQPAQEPHWGRYMPEPIHNPTRVSNPAHALMHGHPQHSPSPQRSKTYTHNRPLSAHVHPMVKKTNSNMLLSSADLQRHVSYQRYSMPAKSPSFYAAASPPPPPSWPTTPPLLHSYPPHPPDFHYVYPEKLETNDF
ncbi:hypothetical protein DM01DRAFT_330286 [Hesseltinella vesiculosa]|uniref:Uncharacterized protein n=1 Tax=Hesseltinella vesiculosa TaxID=101127 RepID=A0A1X2GJZ9_9FUNG|nr:hypothetical protein DM01DRAFT_330286 [Hesseltinella vesiculosa]